MSILNRASDGLLSVLIALWRTVLAYGPQAETTLLDLAAPVSVVPKGKPEKARQTLNRWKQLGFFRETDGLLTLHASLSGIGCDDLDGLRRAVLRLVLLPDNNLRVALGEGEEEQPGASDCTRAITWALAQDPYDFPGSYDQGVELLQDRQLIEPRPFINNSRWPSFVEWAVFLGFGWTAKSDFVPDPGFAVSAVLDDVFEGVTELGEEECLTRLAGHLPVIDRGSYRAAVESQIARPWRSFNANEISPTLSAALLRLEVTGSLRLEARSDAPTRMLLGRHGRDLRAISHVIRLGAM